MASLARTSLASSSRLAYPQRLPPLIRASAQQLRHHSAPADPTSLASYAYTNPSPSELPPHLADTSGTSNLPPHHQETIASLLRVDHSGEIAANTIYSAQSSTFRDIRKDLPSAELTLDMWENEKKHLKVAEMLLQQYRVRPSLLNPVWGMLGSVLGGGTALMGREAAMACTEAVETVIGEHYDE
jgi:3-demethoxyubiquinol 3-hydroxylase